MRCSAGLKLPTGWFEQCWTVYLNVGRRPNGSERHKGDRFGSRWAFNVVLPKSETHHMSAYQTLRRTDAWWHDNLLVVQSETVQIPSSMNYSGNLPWRTWHRCGTWRLDEVPSFGTARAQVRALKVSRPLPALALWNVFFFADEWMKYIINNHGHMFHVWYLLVIPLRFPNVCKMQ